MHGPHASRLSCTLPYGLATLPADQSPCWNLPCTPRFTCALHTAPSRRPHDSGLCASLTGSRVSFSFETKLSESSSGSVIFGEGHRSLLKDLVTAVFLDRWHLRVVLSLVERKGRRFCTGLATSDVWQGVSRCRFGHNRPLTV